MTLHLIKLSVGSESVESLAAWQAGRLAETGRSVHRTRMMPKRKEARAHRPFQGWRYLEPKDAPPDITAETGDLADMPPEMLRDLRTLGLL